MTNRPSPPIWAQRLVERVARGSAAGSSLQGDLWEEWSRTCQRRGSAAAHRWYAYHAVRLAVGYGGGRVLDVVGRMPAALASDARHAVRALRRSPGFTAVAVVSLGGGLGLTTAVFSAINAIWLAPLPWPGADRLVDIDLNHPVEVCEGCSVGAAYADYLRWREADTGLEAIGAMDGLTVLLTGGPGAARVPATAISAEVPGLLGVGTARGRLFSESEHAAGLGLGVVVLSHGLWTRRFGADPEVIGSTLTVDGTPREVVGVLAPETRLLDRGELWMPLESNRTAADADELGLWVFGRTGTRESREVRTRLNAISAESPRAAADDRWQVRVRPMRSALTGEVAPASLGIVFLVGAGLVLVIATLNLASLLLARVTQRAREMTLRSALGAGRARIVRLVLVEAGMVALAGAILALGLTEVAQAQIVRAFAGFFPPWLGFGVDRRVLAVGFGAAGATIVLCGLGPALRAAEGSSVGHAGAAGRDRDHRVVLRQQLLLGGQIVVGMALACGTLLSVRSFQRIADFEGLGYRTEAIAGVRVVTDGPRYADVAARWSLAGRMMEEMGRMGSAQGVAVEAPLFIGSWGAADGPSPMHVLGRAEPVLDRIVPRHSLAVTAGYFELFEIPIVRGRGIEETDGAGAAPVAVVSRRAAEEIWPGSDPIGEQFRVDNGSVDGVVTVVGVSEDIVLNPLSESRTPQPRIYFSLPQTNASELVFRAGLVGSAPSLREWAERLAAVDPELPIDEVTTVRGELRRWITPVRVTAGLMGTLGAMALTLLALGIFGTLNYQVAAGTHEIGIRRALGAPAQRLVRETAMGVLRVLSIGLALGAGAAVVGGNLLQASFVRLGTSEPIVIVVASTVVLAAAGLAAVGPLRAALTVDPIEALKTE